MNVLQHFHFYSRIYRGTAITGEGDAGSPVLRSGCPKATKTRDVIFALHFAPSLGCCLLLLPVSARHCCRPSLPPQPLAFSSPPRLPHRLRSETSACGRDTDQ